MSYKDMDVDSKFAKTYRNLCNIRPFYSAIYEGLNRVKNNNVPTIGVSCTELVYNEDFINSLEFEELMFTELHEIGHVALMHVSRRNNRDAILWNIACDLYVNKMLAEEFNILPGKTSIDGNIKFLKNALYCDSIDLVSDYAEEIYEDLYRQGCKNGYNNSNLQDELSGKTFHFEYTGSADSKKRASSAHSKSNKNRTFKIDLQPNLYKYSDIMDSDADQLTKDDTNWRLVQNALTKCAMNKGIGDTACKLEFSVNEIMKSHLDWRKLLRSYCIKTTSTDTSFARPDKRMYYQSAIYPGRQVDESSTINGVKVCFDSSGSISDEDIAYFYGQVQAILKEFKVRAELIYWDTEIASCGPFSEFKEMKNIKACGRGGTNPECLFNYFDSKKCKEKPIVTLVFTDGYIEGDLSDNVWKRKYKDTIWVMTRQYDKNFKPDFGKIAIARFD